MKESKKAVIRHILIYTALFSLIFLLNYIKVIIAGKSLINNDDCLAFHYELISCKSAMYKEFWHNLVYNHTFAFPFVNLTLSGDNNLFILMGQDVFDFILYLVNPDYLEIAFSIAIVVRLWLSGLTFYGFCRYRGCRLYPSLIAGIIYVFCGWTIGYASAQPFFITMLYMTPLLLIGIERILSIKKGLLFSIVSCFTLLVSIYCAWYELLSITIYMILRLIQINRPIKASINSLIRIGIYYILGVAFSFFLSLPIALSILESNRIGDLDVGSQIASVYNIEHIKEMLTGFFVGIEGDGNFISSYLAVAFIPIVYCLWDKREKMVKWWIVITIILMCLPIFGFVAGFGIPNNRWSYCLSGAVSYACACNLPYLIDNNMDKKERRNIILTASSITVCFACAGLSKMDINLIIEAVLAAISIMVMLLGFSYMGKRMRYVCVLGLLMISASVNGYFIENDKFINMQLAFGEANEILAGYPENYIKFSEPQTPSNQFYRCDINTFQDEISCNIPHYLQLNGVSSFLNVINSSVAEYSVENGNIGSIQSNKFSNLNGRTSDEILACVKYYAVDGIGIDKIPYGFTESDIPKASGDAMIFESNNVLPIGYTYSSYIDKNAFYTLNIAERQEMLLKSVVLEEGSTTEKATAAYLPELSSFEVKNYSSVMQGITMDEVFRVDSKDAYIDIVMEQPMDMCELYLDISNIYSEENSRVLCSYGDNMDIAFLCGPEHQRPNGLSEAIFNLGTNVQAGDVIHISFSKPSVISFSGIKLYARDLSSVDSDVEKLREEVLENINIQTNSITGTTALSSDKYLCFSIPYSKGWSCYVDGEKVDVIKANNMYLAVKLDKGKHDVALKYFPYGMRMGIAISVISVLGSILMFAIKKKAGDIYGSKSI